MKTMSSGFTNTSTSDRARRSFGKLSSGSLHYSSSSSGSGRQQQQQSTSSPLNCSSPSPTLHLHHQKMNEVYATTGHGGNSTQRTNSLTRRSLRLPDCITRSNLCPAVLRRNTSVSGRTSYNNDNSNNPQRLPRNSVPNEKTITTAATGGRILSSNSNNRSNNNRSSIKGAVGGGDPVHSSPAVRSDYNAFSKLSSSHNYHSISNSNSPHKFTCSNTYSSDETNDVATIKIQMKGTLIRKYKEAFESVDMDNDGRICPDELKQAFQKLGNVVSEREVERMIYRVDIDCNGTVEFDEFVLMMQQYSKLKSENYVVDTEESEIHDAFKAFDHNGDGFIDSEEIKKTMAALGESVSDSDVLAMIDEADVDQDGKIDFEEFKKIMTIFKRRIPEN